MNKTKFFKRFTEFRAIYEIESLANSIDKLSIFLAIEVNCFGSVRLERLINELDEAEETSGNMINIEKKGSKVSISDIYYDGPESERKYFIIAIPELIKLMKQWEKLMQEKSDEIILSEQNGKFELVGNNYSKSSIFGVLKERIKKFSLF